MKKYAAHTNGRRVATHKNSFVQRTRKSEEHERLVSLEQRGYEHGQIGYGFQKAVAGRKGSAGYNAYRRGYDAGVDNSGRRTSAVESPVMSVTERIRRILEAIAPEDLTKAERQILTLVR